METIAALLLIFVVFFPIGYLLPHFFIISDCWDAKKAGFSNDEIVEIEGKWVEKFL